MNWYLFWKLTHIVGAFGFVASHGSTAAVALRLRREREPERVRALLDLSRSTRGLMYVALLVLLVGGIANAFFVVSYPEMGWLYTAIVLLAALLVVAFPLAVPYYMAIRRAVSAEPVDRDALAALLASVRPLVVMWTETVGILVIVWLMVFKPF